MGVVVINIHSHGKVYASMLGLSPQTEIFHDPIQNVRVQFWGSEESDSWIELIEPVGEDSPYGGRGTWAGDAITCVMRLRTSRKP
jgi:hypothetical protein